MVSTAIWIAWNSAEKIEASIGRDAKHGDRLGTAAEQTPSLDFEPSVKISQELPYFLSFRSRNLVL